MNDPLTGLPDRWQFLDTLKLEVDRATEQQSKLALLVVEIKNFQRINMLHKYSTGDKVLKSFADLLSQVARKQDFVFRIGDCKFTLLLRDIASEEHAKLAAYKIHRMMEGTFEYQLEKIHCDATIGISLCPDNAVESDDLLQQAEVALSSAKQSGYSTSVTEKNKDDSIFNELELEVEILSAIELSQIKVFFQPKISVKTGLPSGAEALIRWQHPVRGLLGPNQFLPIAESAGLLKPITNWTLNSALRLSKQWTEKWGDLKVSVNIPSTFIEQADFVDIVKNAVGLWKKENITLCLEILEGSFISNISSSFQTLKEVQKSGVKISIDDFGTGYSSLSYFRDIPANELKVDQSFVMGLQNDPANLKIVSLIIDLAHRFDLSVVAEGVENIEVVDVLKQLKCDEFQGYYFSRPIAADEFEHWLENYEPEI